MEKSSPCSISSFGKFNFHSNCTSWVNYIFAQCKGNKEKKNPEKIGATGEEDRIMKLGQLSLRMTS